MQRRMRGNENDLSRSRGYQRLVRARRHNHESFSQVIRRAHWDGLNHSTSAILAAIEKLRLLDETTIRELEAIQKNDWPPRVR
jgi:hypothetical protein